MSTGLPEPHHFCLLAGFLAGRPVDVAVGPADEPAYTDGRVVFVSANADRDRQRREVLVQSALLGAGSLDGQYIKRLRARPSLARRYLGLEGHRVLAELGPRIALAASVAPASATQSASCEESLQIALGRTELDAPPDWFGTIKPSKLIRARGEPGSPAADADVGMNVAYTDPSEMDEDDDDAGPAEKSWILKLFEAPIGMQAPVKFLRTLFGSSHSTGSEGAGGEVGVGSIRRTSRVGVNARPMPTPIRFVDADRPGAALTVGGALYPEWDAFGRRYRENWCRVIDYPITAPADVSTVRVARDAVLRRRLARVGLGPKVLRARADGDDVDIEAVIGLSVDLRSGHSPPEHVYTERRRLARNLGVLILVDASGSATDADGEGLAVHDHQRRAAATLAVTLEELGDRVAVYGFRSQGRRAVHLLAVKTFGQGFGARERARLSQLQPFGYTRLGAGIRGAGEILKTQAGTPHRLLIVLSDGYPYDDGYEGRYAQADTAKALEELRADGVACLCLSIGTDGDADALDRVFGPASHAGAATLSELSPRMDELFQSALAELAAPKPR
ncbi:nitric oxide reductase activation protein NorD [Mycolicibacterium neworleansense]|uniref:von Willebrand factor, type A n=1 Tax=Mycolicibacterium neworleansense TaxID=146018 RepID=A0A0H5RS30_9MYCO|nr:VWA domain-containing protein [Mycolicibacterium neworleansense]MCV7361610.1 VWA domain-containing protein [Mycolicibacterium neworleansense]CRZ16965.1 von Willebrand factor, type A [Mycolicibacterium neworleansense]